VIFSWLVVALAEPCFVSGIFCPDRQGNTGQPTAANMRGAGSGLDRRHGISWGGCGRSGCFGSQLCGYGFQDRACGFLPGRTSARGRGRSGGTAPTTSHAMSQRVHFNVMGGPARAEGCLRGVRTGPVNLLDPGPSSGDRWLSCHPGLSCHQWPVLVSCLVDFWGFVLVRVGSCFFRVIPASKPVRVAYWVGFPVAGFEPGDLLAAGRRAGPWAAVIWFVGQSGSRAGRAVAGRARRARDR